MDTITGKRENTASQNNKLFRLKATDSAEDYLLMMMTMMLVITGILSKDNIV